MALARQWTIIRIIIPAIATGGARKRHQLLIREARSSASRQIPAKRLGDHDGFGAACAFLCSAQAGFITGQNLMIDGGAYSGVF